MRQKSLLPLAVAATALALSLTGCSGATSSAPITVTATVTATPTRAPTPTRTRPADSAAFATALKAAIPQVSKVVVITEDNDPNNSIGRPNGYTSAAVLYDKRTKCSRGLGADCGATIEQWPTARDAKARASYIQGIYKKAPVLGSEYDTVKGTYLLRVSGDLKPSQAKAYSDAFSAGF